MAPIIEVRDLVKRYRAATAFASKDAATGELGGLDVEIGRALAVRLGVPFEAIEYATSAALTEALRAGRIEIGTQAFAELSAQLDATAPFAEVDNTYLVPAGSPIRRAADADRPGVRVVVGRGTAPEASLSRDLTLATLIRTDGAMASFELLRTGQVDALATNRPNALSFAARLPGSRVLEDRFATQQRVLAVPTGRPALHAHVSVFAEEAKASGLVRQAIMRAGVQGVQALGAGAAPTQLPRTGAPPADLAGPLAGVALAALGWRLRRPLAVVGRGTRPTDPAQLVARLERPRQRPPAEDRRSPCREQAT
jgi:polar amino acid transport system substrate-binding protein